MNQRELVIIEMLRSRNDFIDEGRKGGAGLLGGYSHQYGPNFGPAFRELERLLDVMRWERPKQRRHVIARYVDCKRRPLEVPFVRVKRHGDVRFRYQLPAHTELANPDVAPSVMDSKLARVLVYQWDSWVKDQLASRGVSWLADAFDGVPSLGKEPALAA